MTVLTACIGIGLKGMHYHNQQRYKIKNAYDTRHEHWGAEKHSFYYDGLYGYFYTGPNVYRYFY